MMLYMVIETFKDGSARAVYERARERGRLLPDGMRCVDSWVSQDLDVCFQLMESRSAELFGSWIRHWEDLVEFDVVPVLPSADAAERILGEPFP